MTGYTRTWDCLICTERNETIDNPRVAIRAKCIAPLAARLCFEALRVRYTAEGVDRRHWEEKAWDYAALLWKRRPTNIRHKAEDAR